MFRLTKFILIAGLCLTSSLNANFYVAVLNASDKPVKVKFAEYFPDKKLFWGKDLSEKSVTIDSKKSYLFGSNTIDSIFKYSGSGKICMTYYPVSTIMPQKIWKGYQYTAEHSILLDSVSKEVNEQIKKDLAKFNKEVKEQIKKDLAKFNNEKSNGKNYTYTENLYGVYIVIKKDLTCYIDKDDKKRSFFSDAGFINYASLMVEHGIEDLMDQK